MCVGAALLTSQTAFGGQLPYKGSLVRPVVRFDHNPLLYDGTFLRTTNHEPLFFHEPKVTRGDVIILNLSPQSGIWVQGGLRPAGPLGPLYIFPHTFY